MFLPFFSMFPSLFPPSLPLFFLLFLPPFPGMHCTEESNDPKRYAEKVKCPLPCTSSWEAVRVRRSCLFWRWAVYILDNLCVSCFLSYCAAVFIGCRPRGLRFFPILLRPPLPSACYQLLPLSLSARGASSQACVMTWPWTRLVQPDGWGMF